MKKKSLIMMASDKGGCRKSTNSIILSEILEKLKVKTARIDMDLENSTFSKVIGKKNADGSYNSDPFESVTVFDVREQTQEHQLIQVSLIDSDIILCDTPAHVRSSILKVVDRSSGSADEYVESIKMFSDNVQLVFFHMITHEEESVSSMKKYLDLFAPHKDLVRHVAVLNLLDHSNNLKETFRTWFGTEEKVLDKNKKPTGEVVVKGGKTRQKFLEDGGFEMVLGNIPYETFQLIKFNKYRYMDVSGGMPKYDILNLAENRIVFKVLQNAEQDVKKLLEWLES